MRGKYDVGEYDCYYYKLKYYYYSFYFFTVKLKCIICMLIAYGLQ